MQRPTIIPSEDETAFIARILEHADSQQVGYLTPQSAIDVFNRSGLSRVELRDIWKLSDADSNGKLSQDELAVAIRLMGWMQSGRPFSESLLEKPGPLPTLEGIPLPKLPKLRSPKEGFPPIVSTDVQEYHQEFQDAGPVDGYLEGDRVRDVFLRYNLAYHDLSAIWLLLDTSSRGHLNFHQFALGLYLIQAIRSCRLKSVPTSVPSEIREEVEGTSQAVLKELQSPFLAPGESSDVMPPPKPTRPPPPPPTKSPKVPPKPPPIKPKPGLKPWVITSREKGESDRTFADLDVDGKGQISQDTVSGYLGQYHLLENDLSHIIHIASIRNDKNLTSEEFAVANHLTQAAARGKPIPPELPYSLIPPTLRVSISPLNSPKLPSPPPKPAQLETDSGPSSPPPSGYSHSANASTSSLTFLTEHPSKRYGTSPKPDSISRRMSSAGYSSTPTPTLENYEDNEHPHRRYTPPKPESLSRRMSSATATPISEDYEDPLEELKTETKTLRRQIDTLLSQLSAQHDLRNQNDDFRSENTRLKSKVADLEASIASVLTQMQNNDNALSEELTKEIERLARRVAELEQTENQLQQTAGILEVSKRDNANMAAQLRDLRSAEVKMKGELEDAKHAMEDFEKESAELKQRLMDMTKVLSGPANGKGGDNAKELRILLADTTRDNQTLRSRMRATEKSMEQLLLSGKNTAQNDELRRQNRELQMQVQELEQIAAQLQSSHEDNHLQQVLLAVTRENEGMKVRIREMQTSGAQVRSDYDVRVLEMQRKLDELTAENTRLKTEVQESSGNRHSMDVPPPAYDDSYIPEDLR